MKYQEVIITFQELDESGRSELSQLAINDYECLGVEELNLDFSESDLEDWQLQSAKEDIKQLAQESDRLKFFYDFESEKISDFIAYVEENFSVESIEKVIGNSQDWENEWKKYLDPIIVSKNLKINFITDDSLKPELMDSELQIYPGMGFGTGGHETTFLCLQVMEALLEKGTISSCLDFGCGSGILGILAAKRKVKKVDYYDIDDDALINCRQNLKINSLHPESQKITSSKNTLDNSYDLVLANILLHILILEKEDIIKMSNKDLILSGLLKTQEEEILSEYLKDDIFAVKGIFYKNEWMAIHLERRK